MLSAALTLETCVAWLWFSVVASPEFGALIVSDGQLAKISMLSTVNAGHIFKDIYEGLCKNC